MTTLTKAEMRTIKNLLTKAEGSIPAKKASKPPVDPARHNATKKLVAWLKANKKTETATFIKASFALQKGGFIGQWAFDKAASWGYKA